MGVIVTSYLAAIASVAAFGMTVLWREMRNDELTAPETANQAGAVAALLFVLQIVLWIIAGREGGAQ